tara:strand:- start:131 stop:637 length:507 start_codon:yes stop_codon:yes gene_type:complete
MQKKFLINFLLFLFFFIPANSEIISGKAITIDGDTIKIKNKKIRLHGIDAPEIKQLCQRTFLSIFIFSFQENYKCGEISKKKLEKYVKNNIIKCKVEGIDRYKRILGTCYKNTININSRMVRNGYAVAYKKYSKKYLSAEREAKREELGLWKGKFDMPWDWRKNVKKK